MMFKYYHRLKNRQNLSSTRKHNQFERAKSRQSPEQKDFTQSTSYINRTNIQKIFSIIFKLYNTLQLISRINAHNNRNPTLNIATRYHIIHCCQFPTIIFLGFVNKRSLIICNHPISNNSQKTASNP